MTDQQKQAKTYNLIPKPIQRAFYAGVSAGGFSFVFGVPAEYVPRIAVAGACYSLAISWQELGKIKRRPRGRQVIVNGDRKIDLEYSIQSGYILRETWGDTLQRWVYGKSKVRQIERPVHNVQRPSELDKFFFLSQGIQLQEEHVKLFLRSAWRNRQYGKGLSHRRWVRRASQREAWYKEIADPAAWYQAVMALLFNTQATLGLQIVIIKANQWMSLACDPFTAMRLLKWYESEKK